MRRYARPRVIEGLAGRSRKKRSPASAQGSRQAPAASLMAAYAENSTATPTGGSWPRAPESSREQPRADDGDRLTAVGQHSQKRPIQIFSHHECDSAVDRALYLFLGSAAGL